MAFSLENFVEVYGGSIAIVGGFFLFVAFLKAVGEIMRAMFKIIRIDKLDKF